MRPRAEEGPLLPERLKPWPDMRREVLVRGAIPIRAKPPRRALDDNGYAGGAGSGGSPPREVWEAAASQESTSKTAAPQTTPPADRIAGRAVGVFRSMVFDIFHVLGKVQNFVRD